MAGGWSAVAVSWFRGQSAEADEFEQLLDDRDLGNV